MTISTADLLKMTEGHTPGPWTYTRTGSKVSTVAEHAEKRTYGYGCDNDFIADLNDGEYHEYEDLQEQLANAKLIAQAPEIRKRFIEAMALLRGMNSEVNLPAVEVAARYAKLLAGEL